MSKIVRSSCPECDVEVEVSSDSINMVVDKSDRQLAFYNFICPQPEHNGLVSRRIYQERIIELLINSGCEVTEASIAVTTEQRREHTEIEEQFGTMTPDTEFADLMRLGNSSTMTPASIFGSATVIEMFNEIQGSSTDLPKKPEL